MAYIPQGADQQGRIKRTGVWYPRRCDGTPEAAHAATPIGADDQDAWEPMTWSEILRLTAPAIAAVLGAVVVIGFGWW